MNKKTFQVFAMILAFAMTAVAAMPVSAHDDEEAAASPEASPMAMATGAAYMTISNSGDVADRLVSASTEMAESIELHTTFDDGGVMKMQPLEDGIEIPAGEQVELQPGGLHVMLIGLAGDLVPGSSYTLTLEFAEAGTVDVEVPVFANSDDAMAAEALPAVVAGDISVEGAWSRQAPGLADGSGMHADGTPAAGEGEMHGAETSTKGEHGGGGMGAAYMVITNRGAEADRLVGGSTAVADVVEIHEIVEAGGVMEMRPLGEGLEIGADSTVTLEPGGYHVMLIGLTQDLTAGESYELTLVFEHAGEVVVTVAIGMGNEAPAEAVDEAVTAGDLIISDVWSRAAPSMS